MIFTIALLLAMWPFHSHTKPSPPVVQDSEEVVQDKMFVMGVEEKIPMWVNDKSYARYEETEIVNVAVDCKEAHDAGTEKDFLKIMSKLHADWDILVSLDQKLHTEDYI